MQSEEAGYVLACQTKTTAQERAQRPRPAAPCTLRFRAPFPMNVRLIQGEADRPERWRTESVFTLAGRIPRNFMSPCSTRWAMRVPPRPPGVGESRFAHGILGSEST